MKQVWIYALKAGWALFGPALLPLQASPSRDASIGIREPVRVDILLIQGPPGLDPRTPSIGAVTNLTALMLPWATVQGDEVLWHGDPETDPRLAPLYRMYHQAVAARERAQQPVKRA